MSYAEDFEDDGAILAEQDSFIDDCEELDGNCKKCPNKYICWSSDYNKNKERY